MVFRLVLKQHRAILKIQRLLSKKNTSNSAKLSTNHGQINARILQPFLF